MINHVVRLLADNELKQTLAPLPQVVPGDNTLQTVFNLVMATLTSVAFLIIVLAGLKYITSSGDPQGVASARRAIIYSAVGLAVCAASWSIVTFVVGTV